MIMALLILTIGLMILMLLLAVGSGPERRDARISRLSETVKMQETHIASLKRELADIIAGRQRSAPCGD